MQCCEQIGGGYIRQIGTKLPYCDYECYALWCNHVRAPEDRVRAAS
jgi:hypothetical protein